MGRLCVILAGGQGTRLRARLGDLPKPMIPIGGKPLLEHQVDLARHYGFTRVLLFVCHRADLIQAHFETGRRRGLEIDYVLETQPLGTAGAVLAALDRLDDRFAVLYGDTMMNVDLERLWQAHARAGADATLLLHPNDHPLDSDLVALNTDGWITAFHNRPHPPGVWRQNLVNAGLYVLERHALEASRGGVRQNAAILPDGQSAPPTDAGSRGVLDFGKDLFPAMLRAGARLRGYVSPEYAKDIGTPERYDRVCAEFANGVVQRSSLATPQRAVFLDRDGTLIHDRDCLRTADELDLLPGAAAAVRELNHHGWRAVVITNQPVIAKGWCTEAELARIHAKLETLLGREHAFLDRIYYCPHHPEAGFEGERTELKIPCACRKPAIGMIQRAAADLHIDLAQSWLIGDTTTDLLTARNAGLRSILVRTGAAGRDGKYVVSPDLTCDTLEEAVAGVVRSPAPGACEPAHRV